MAAAQKATGVTRRAWTGLLAVRRGHEEKGFTLIELMVALLILAILMSASLVGILQGFRLSRSTQDRVVAANLATSVLEQAESKAITTAGFTTVEATITSPATNSQVQQGVTYTSTETSEWEAEGEGSSVCALANANGGTSTVTTYILRTTVETTWGQSGQSVSQSTLLAPPNGSLSSADGSLPVLVETNDGAPEAGLTVTVSSAGSPSNPITPISITTGSDGCAFFAQLPPGTYTATVSAAGYVSSSEQPTFTDTPITVSAGSQQLVKALYMPAGFIGWTPQEMSWAGTTAPAATAVAGDMPISVAAPGLLANPGIYAYAPGVSTLSPVYPSTYTVFAGACTDADPDGNSSGATPEPFYPASQYPASQYPDLVNSATVVSGQTSDVAVPVYPLDLQIVNSSGATLSTANTDSNAQPTATAGEAGECSGSAETYTLTAVTNGTSDTWVGLGEVTVNVSVTVGNQTESGSATLWIKPDGVYQVKNGTVASAPTSGAIQVAVQ